MRELNILFVNSIDENLIANFRDPEQINDYFEIHKFKANKKDIILVPKHYLKNETDTILVSIDDSLNKLELCEIGSKVRKLIPFDCIISYHFGFKTEIDVQEFTLGLILSGYKFEKYVEADTKEINIQFDESIDIEEQKFIKESIYFVRDLVNLPALDKTPDYFINEVKELISNEQIKLTIFDKKWLLKENFGGVIGVSQGSSKDPYFLVGEYNTDADFQIALIGKGVLFDSGGLSLKSPSGMETMKTDMAGAATAWAVIKLVASLGLDLGVKVYTPLVENMPSSTAIRPGDVLKMRNGKTVEVLNTDAEGRLIMADALAFASEKKPDLICDVATLTGASYVALGVDIGAVISNSEMYAAEFINSNKNQVESYHELPLFHGYKSLIKSSIADMKNTGGRFGGAITAALILEEFVDEIPWVHLDIAGPARARSSSPLNPEGGTGFGVIGFINFFKFLSKNHQ